jgi:hypothetical protein
MSKSKVFPKSVKANPIVASLPFSKKNSNKVKKPFKKTYEKLNISRIACKAKRLSLMMIKKYE